MELSDYRVQIDRIDRQLVELFAQRMETAAGIAAYKKEHGLPVLDPIRERQKLQNVVELAPENMKDYTASLYTLLFELSRGYQNRLLGASTALTAEIQSAIDNTPKLFPSNVPVACQGVAGAYSQLACDKLFKLANIIPMDQAMDAMKEAIKKTYLVKAGQKVVDMNCAAVDQGVPRRVG